MMSVTRLGRATSHRRKLLGGWALSHHRIYHWVAELLPFVETAQQRTNVSDTVLAELQRHTGAGSFVGSSAEQHDFAVPSDFTVPAFQLFGRDLQRSGQRPRIGEHIERMTQVNDNNALTGLQLVL